MGGVRSDRVSAPAAGEDRGLLRVLTCGTVDDGKSTLIGRMLYDLELVPTDQLSSLERESRQSGTVPDGLDFALLLDGLEAEQEQGITIDVAYRYFSTPQRSFIVADAPGHEQYTRNMATGASCSDAAVLLVDARRGISQQTQRHSLIASQFGIRHVIMAVNKCDLVDYSEEVFRKIVADYHALCGTMFEFSTVTPIPVSALHGDNVVRRSARTPWYRGPTLIEHLHALNVSSDRTSRPFRLPVQWVCRPHSEFRGFAGTVTSGGIACGERIMVAGSGAQSRVARILNPAGTSERAEAGDAVTLVLEDEIDVSRGDVLCRPGERPDIVDQFAAHLLWLADDQMMPGRSFLMKIGTRSVPATITALKHRIDVNTGAKLAAHTLTLNEIGFCNMATDSPVAIDSFDDMGQTGAFILIDRFTNVTAGAGMIRFPLRRAQNLHPQHLAVDKAARAAIKTHRPAVLWLTGLSGSGKSTIANAVESRLNALGVHTYLLDGDNIRSGLTRDLGFTQADRVENVRRVAEVARLFVDAGVLAIVSLISPFRAERRAARERLEAGEFVEVFVDTPIEECRRRDPKGLYAKAARGELVNFTGVDSPYEAPEAPELHLTTVGNDPGELADRVVAHLRSVGILVDRVAPRRE